MSKIASAVEAGNVVEQALEARGVTARVTGMGEAEDGFEVTLHVGTHVETAREQSSDDAGDEATSDEAETGDSSAETSDEADSDDEATQEHEYECKCGFTAATQQAFAGHVGGKGDGKHGAVESASSDDSSADDGKSLDDIATDTQEREDEERETTGDDDARSVAETLAAWDAVESEDTLETLYELEQGNAKRKDVLAYLEARLGIEAPERDDDESASSDDSSADDDELKTAEDFIEAFGECACKGCEYGAGDEDKRFCNRHQHSLKTRLPVDGERFPAGVAALANAYIEADDDVYPEEALDKARKNA